MITREKIQEQYLKEKKFSYMNQMVANIDYVKWLETELISVKKQLPINGVVFNEAKKYEQTLENLHQDEKGEYYFGKEKVSEMELCNHVGSVTRDGRGEYCKKCGKIW